MALEPVHAPEAVRHGNTPKGVSPGADLETRADRRAVMDRARDYAEARSNTMSGPGDTRRLRRAVSGRGKRTSASATDVGRSLALCGVRGRSDDSEGQPAATPSLDDGKLVQEGPPPGWALPPRLTGGSEGVGCLVASEKRVGYTRSVHYALSCWRMHMAIFPALRSHGTFVVLS